VVLAFAMEAALSNGLFPFTELMIRVAPNKPGVYTLFKDRKIVFIGCAEGHDTTIRTYLKDHLTGKNGKCTRRATEYSYEITPESTTRAEELLESYKRQFGKLPECNEGTG
jgi:excinuclease UvrABC nuclease subunit